MGQTNKTKQYRHMHKACGKLPDNNAIVISAAIL